MSFKKLLVLLALMLPPLATAADSVFFNARIYTLNPEQPWADTLVVKGDRIAYVGDRAGAQPFIDSDTAQEDLQGRMVLPGLIDTHIHVGDTFPYVFAAALSPDMSPEEYLAAIAEHARRYPDQNPVIGTGFLSAAFGAQGPTAKMLDQVVDDRPVFIYDEGFHSAWINSRAMAMIGLDASTPDPVPGAHYYKRYPNGAPTGWLVESGAYAPAAETLGVVSMENLAAGADSFLSTMSSMGITAAFDAGMLDGGELVLDLFESLVERRALPIRVVGSHHVLTPAALPGALARVRELQRRFHSEFFDVRVLKLTLDGTVEARTAFTLKPYTSPEGYLAQPTIPAGATGDVVVQAAREGVDVHLHALGDGAVRMGLDMVERARNEVPDSPSRYTMCHLQIVNPEDVPRFGELDVIAQSTPTWYAYDDLALESLGEERFHQMYPLRSIAEGGARLTLGSDYPASWIGLDGLNPLFNIEMALTRQPAGDQNFAVQPLQSERITLEQAIRAYTLDAAYQLRLEDQIGSLEAGKQADLVVLNENLFELDRYAIHKARVVMTMVNGEVTFADDARR